MERLPVLFCQEPNYNFQSLSLLPLVRHLTVDEVVAAVVDVVAVVAEKELGNRFLVNFTPLSHGYQGSRSTRHCSSAIQTRSHPHLPVDPIKMLNKSWAVAVAVIAQEL